MSSFRHWQFAPLYYFLIYIAFLSMHFAAHKYPLISHLARSLSSTSGLSGHQNDELLRQYSIPGAHTVAVRSQGDEPHRSVSQNQCGWCAWSLAASGASLVAAYESRSDEAFAALYDAALMEASTWRAEVQRLPGRKCKRGERRLAQE